MIVFLSFSKSLISPITDFISLPTRAKSNKFDLEFGANEYPVKIAPQFCNHKLIHDPLKPVCPVRKNFFVFPKHSIHFNRPKFSTALS